MKILEKFKIKAQDNFNATPVTIAFLGDSVTQGCFELYTTPDGNIETVFDKESAYHRYLDKILSVLYPTVPVSIINAGISGDRAPHGLERLERDVLRFQPDLTVVCFCLNDCTAGIDGLESFRAALAGIFERLRAAGSDIIFMTPNMMNTYISKEITDEAIRQAARDCQYLQNNGIMDAYLDTARKLCKEHGIAVCDCYAKWKKLAQYGADTTRLLANRINHPTREMNWLFATALLETIFDETKQEGIIS